MDLLYNMLYNKSTKIESLQHAKMLQYSLLKKLLSNSKSN